MESNDTEDFSGQFSLYEENSNLKRKRCEEPKDHSKKFKLSGVDAKIPEEKRDHSVFHEVPNLEEFEIIDGFSNTDFSNEPKRATSTPIPSYHANNVETSGTTIQAFEESIVITRTDHEVSENDVMLKDPCLDSFQDNEIEKVISPTDESGTVVISDFSSVSGTFCEEFNLSSETFLGQNDIIFYPDTPEGATKNSDLSTNPGRIEKGACRRLTYLDSPSKIEE